MAPVEADESQPLLGAGNGPPPGHGAGVSASHDRDHDPIYEFDPKGDADNPLDWPSAFKWFIVGLLAAMAFTVTFTCVSVVPVASRIIDDVSGGTADPSASVLLVTIWELGEAAGPLLIAPLSELLGRRPVVHAANALFVAATVLAALSPSAPLLIAARALTGFAVMSNVLSAAIVGDLFASESRGSPMTAVMFAPLLGGAVGPAISGAVAQSAGWRVVLWMSAGLAAACEGLFLCCFRETYKVSILKRRAVRLRAEGAAHSAGYVSAVPVSGIDPTATDDAAVGAGGGSGQLWESIRRPALVMFGSGVLASLSFYGAFAFSHFYNMSVTVPTILQDIYGLSPAATGSCFLTFSIGSLISVCICNVSLDRIYIRLKETNGGIGRPEYRLPLCIAGAALLPFTLAAYGWTAELRLPLPVLLAVIIAMGVALILILPPTMAYVVDAFGLYSASAMTGLIVSRCLAGTLLPLAVGPLDEAYGYGWGFTVLAALMICLAPIPIALLRYGPKWRQHSKYTKDA